MKVDARNLLKQSADALDATAHPYGAMYAFSLRELADNLDELGRNPEQYDEFAELYCLPAPHPTGQQQ